MAKFITRTFEGTKANCMVYNLNSKKIENMVLVVETTDEKKLEKEIAKHIPEGYRFIAVENSVVVSELRAMTPETFLANSILLDSATRKPIEK